MKSLSVKLGVILIGFVIFGCAEVREEVREADWKFYGSGEAYLGYYDAQSITHPSKNIVRVWVIWDWKEKGVISWVENLGKKYENLSHAITLTEINCLEKEFRSLSGIYYDNKGGVIFSYSSPSEWDFIIPESISESLYKEVCKSKGDETE